MCEINLVIANQRILDPSMGDCAVTAGSFVIGIGLQEKLWTSSPLGFFSIMLRAKSQVSPVHLLMRIGAIKAEGARGSTISKHTLFDWQNAGVAKGARAAAAKNNFLMASS